MSTSTPIDLGDLGSGDKIERVRSVTINTPRGGPDTIRIRQEAIAEVGGEKVSGYRGEARGIRKTFSEVADETVTVDEVTVSATQLRAFIAAFADKWRAEEAS
jgi:hypothetical protein